MAPAPSQIYESIVRPMPADIWVPDTIPAMLSRAVAERPAAVALRCGDVALTYADYEAAVGALGSRVPSGATVALLLRNSIAMAVAMFGVHRAGGIVAALNPDYTAAELAPMIDCAAPALIIGHDDVLDGIAGILPPGVAVVAVDDDAGFLAWLAGIGGAPVMAMPAPDAVAVLQFTGGTTGRPKGVELTQGAVATNVAQREAALPTRFGDEVVLCLMPMFHSFAAAMCVHLAAYAAATLVILPRYRPDRVFDAIAAHGVTRLPAGPTVFVGLLGHERLSREAMASVRSAWSGSAPLPEATLRQWQEATGVPILEGYGQSEAGPVLTYQTPDRPARAGSVGRPLPGTAITITPDGEILARGPQIMRGYRDDPAATAEALVDGWLRTGDIGTIDADGELRILDRRKDMVIVGGYNVFPREVDEVLALHGDVAAAACIGAPDPYRGERIVAFIVPVPDRAPADGDATAMMQALADHCETRLVRYKRPAEYRFVDALPLTRVGKVDKAALRALAARPDPREQLSGTVIHVA